MSTEHARDGRGVAPPTLEAILDAAREADFAVSEDPTHDLTTASVGELELRARLPHADVSVTNRDDIDLDPAASAWPTPDYDDCDGEVSISLRADGDDTDTRISTVAEMSQNEARDLAVQLLASAAVVDDDQEDGLPGYTDE